MSVRTGTRIGPYEFTSLLGQGGMGEVYRGREPRLARDVAIKVLPEHLASDPERIARFELEARTLAALNHPHIAQVYGFEHEGGTLALAMEFVDGQDLAARLRRGALPLDEALPIAQQIAEGLAYAHEHGVVHRDLKPANIKVTPEGVVKILDFGLAKAFVADPESADADAQATSPTMTSPAMTQRGWIMGSAAYMSPEQARGRAVDRRTDIWAFGCVLFEMLSGERLFKGEDVTETIVLVMSRDPAWEALPATTPSAIRTLLRRCLQRDRARRLSDIHDAQLDIDDVLSGLGAADGSRPVPSVAPRRWSGAWWAIPGVAAGALAVWAMLAGGLLPSGRPVTPDQLRVSIVHADGYEAAAPAISPDATRVVYRARTPDGMPMLWVRHLQSGELRVLPGTENGLDPSWSPDSREIAFRAGPLLKRVSADGGPVQIVLRDWMGNGASWGANGLLLVNKSDIEGISRTTIGGDGVLVPVTTVAKDTVDQWPFLLPDGNHFLFFRLVYSASAEAGEGGIFVGALDGSEPRRLLPDWSNAVFANGHLVFVRDGLLTAVPFDPSTGTVSGTPATIGGPVARSDVNLFFGVSAARDGTLAVRPPPAVLHPTQSGTAQIVVFDRTGRRVSASATGAYAVRMVLHPAGERLAVEAIDQRTRTTDVEEINIVTGVRTPLTATRFWAGRPAWSHDGLRLAYAYQPAGRLDDVYIKDLKTGTETPAIESQDHLEQPAAWSHDGRTLLVYRVVDGKTSLDAWSFESKTLTPFLTGPGRYNLWARFSPDDRYVAYTTLLTDHEEVRIATFPDHEQSWSVTSDGGRLVSWSRDGRELLVASLSGHILAYPVSFSSGAPLIGQPTVLIRDLGVAAQFAAANADHSRIVVRLDPGMAQDKGEMQLLFGWARGGSAIQAR